MKLKILDWRPDGYLPDWWMGHVYFDYCTNRARMAVVPLNWILKAIWWFHREYLTVTHGPSWIDKEIKRQAEILAAETRRWK